MSSWAPAAHSSAQSTFANPVLENERIVGYLGAIWGICVAVIFIYTWVRYGLHYIRLLSAMNAKDISNDKQLLFATPNEKWAKMKKYFLDAPLVNKRHNRNFQLGSFDAGVLPSRFQTLFLLGYVGINILFTFIAIDYSDPKYLTYLGDRTGVLATWNLLPLIVLVGRNNPLTKLMNISFDNCNMIHRWTGRVVVLEVIAHVVIWMITTVRTKGWQTVALLMSPRGHDKLILTGTVSTVAFLLMLLLSPAAIRHAWYETFLHIHVIMALLAFASLWPHLKSLPQQGVVFAVFALWLAERSWRLFTIVRHNVGNGGTHAEVEALSGAVRVTIKIARPWNFQPGQHLYLYMPSVGLWTNHPFSIAWSEEGYSDNDLPMYEEEKGFVVHGRELLRTHTTMSLLIRRKKGFTDKLYRKAETAGGRFTTIAYVEGPYGSQSLTSYGTVMLFAAGVGITHQLPMVRELVAAHANGTAATRKVILVWIIQTPDQLEWVRPWMTSILGMEGRRDVLTVKLFVTRPGPNSAGEIYSPSATVQMFSGRPNIGALVEQEQKAQVGAMALSVCGTGGLSDDVRHAARMGCEQTEIDFIENTFTW